MPNTSGYLSSCEIDWSHSVAVEVEGIMDLRHTAAILLLCITAPASFGQDVSQWQNLGRLKPGQSIGVIQSDLKRVEGRFENVTESGITLRANEVVTVPQEKVIRVYRKPRVKRVFRAAVGTGIGAVVGAILTKYCRRTFSERRPGCTHCCLDSGRRWNWGRSWRPYRRRLSDALLTFCQALKRPGTVHASRLARSHWARRAPAS